MLSSNHIPEGWVETTIGNLVELAQGVAVNAKTNHVLSDKGNGLPLLKINNLLNDTIDQYANPDLVPKKSIIHKNDVIFTRTGQVGEVLINKYGILHNNSFKVIPNEKLYWNYLYWYLKSNRVYNYVQKVASGSVQMDLNHSAFKTIEIKYPTNIDEQKAIAKVLTAFDDKIELLQAQNKTLETMAQTIFKEWFGKYQIGDELPEGWRVGKLDEVLSICGGTTPSTKNPDFWDGKINWSSPKDLSNSKGLFLLNTEKKITKEGLNKISSGLLPKGTLLLSSRAPVGYLSITHIELAINQGYIALLPQQYLSNNYMYLWLDKYMQVVKNAANGSTFLEISKTAFRNIECVIPMQDILEKFDEIIEPIFSKVLYNTIQIQSLTTSRDTLLPKLMSGQVRVNNIKQTTDA